MFRQLNEYLQQQRLPRVTYTRDSQLYTRAAEQGLGICDVSGSRAAKVPVPDMRSPKRAA